MISPPLSIRRFLDNRHDAAAHEYSAVKSQPKVAGVAASEKMRAAASHRLGVAPGTKMRYALLRRGVKKKKWRFTRSHLTVASLSPV